MPAASPGQEQNSTLLEGHLYDFYTAFPGEPKPRPPHHHNGSSPAKPFPLNFVKQQGVQMYRVGAPGTTAKLYPAALPSFQKNEHLYAPVSSRSRD